MIVRNGQKLGSVLVSREEPSAGPAPEPEPATPVVPVRPPTSGPGSGAPAWREYAAAVTGTPVEEWSTLSRDEIVELLDKPEEELTNGA